MGSSSHLESFHKQYEDIDSNRLLPSRILFVIIDALRLDFMTLHHNHANTSSSYNKLTTIHDMLLHNSSQCALFGFRADPPTTTSQRLRAIVTGGLPTFVDIGSNFNTGQVNEDSLLHKWRESKKRIVMLGDDTWTHLFDADMFTASHPFESFTTRDIHSVDNGILDALPHYLDDCSANKRTPSFEPSCWSKGPLPPECRGEACQWDILITHFLGVDHVGHTYTAHHPLMGDKLQAMNEVIKRVVSFLPDGVLLVVMGDHGMTDAGEHGT